MFGNLIRKWIPVILYLFIWMLTILVFWFFTDGSDAMGFSLVYFWFLLPVSTFLLSLALGNSRHWGKIRWVWCLVFGVMYMLAAYVTFQTANMTATGIVRIPDWKMIWIGALISFAGMVAGALHRAKKWKKKDK